MSKLTKEQGISYTSNHSRPEGFPLSSTNYFYLEEVDLTEAQMDSTMEAYNTETDQYSELEWSERTIQIVWDSVFTKIREIIQELPPAKTEIINEREVLIPSAKVMLAGCGSIRDLLAIALLREDVYVIGYDLSPLMLEKGLQNLKWEHIVMLSRLIAERDELAHAWIEEILELFKEIEKFTNFRGKKFVEWAEKGKDIYINGIKDRLLLVEGDLRDQFFAEESLDLTMAVASLPHVPKRSVVDSLSYMIQSLKSGGTLYFNLRVDPERFDHLEEQGRVFADNVLGLYRYFTTYTFAEIDQLVQDLKHRFPGLTVNVHEDITGHPDSNKPPFYNITITKP